MTVQAPITIPVGLTPVRASVAKAPYVLINLSTTATSWLADNPGLKVGHGTPLYPGTSLQWTREGDLWVIGDAAHQILVTYDVADWEPNPAAIAAAVLNAGVLIVDKPVKIFDGTVTPAAPMPSTDISRYQSLLITVFTNTTGFTELSFWFLETATGLVFDRTLEFYPVAALGNSWRGVLPAIGAFFRVLSTASAEVEVIASNRPYADMLQEIGTGPGVTIRQNHLLLVETNIAAAGSFVYTTNPWAGEVEIAVAWVVPGALGTTQLWIEEFITAIGAYRVQDIGTPVLAPGGGRATIKMRHCLGGHSIRIEMLNGHAVAVDFTISIVPVRQGF